MGKLHELLAVEGDLDGTVKKVVAEGAVTFSKKPDHFLGSVRTYEPLVEGDPGLPSESKEMVTTVTEKLAYVFGHVSRHLDAVFQKEVTNQEACQDLVVDGKMIIGGAPATFLLGLESKIKLWRGMVDQIPTLPPGIKWVKDSTRGPDVYVTEKPEEKNRTQKTFKHKVLYEATKEHKAQIEKWEEQEVVGTYRKTVWCGMLSPADKSKLLGRFDTLLREAKKARMRANNVDAHEGTTAGNIVSYLLGE